MRDPVVGCGSTVAIAVWLAASGAVFVFVGHVWGLVTAGGLPLVALVLASVIATVNDRRRSRE